MNTLQIIGLTLAVVSSLLHLATYRPRELEVGLGLVLIGTSIGTPLVIRFAYGSLVNPMAALWGAHSGIKIALASALFVAYVPGSLLALRLARRVAGSARRERAPRGVVDGFRNVRSEAVAWALGQVAGARVLVLGWFLVQACYLVYVAISYPHPLSATGASALASTPGYDWVLIQPTLAIHHTYAAASFFTLNLLSLFILITALPAARAFVHWIGQPRILRGVSAVSALAGLVLAILG